MLDLLERDAIIVVIVGEIVDIVVILPMRLERRNCHFRKLPHMYG